MELTGSVTSHRNRDWHLVARALLLFWCLHLTYRVGLAFLNGSLNELLDPALWAALSFGFVLSVLLCLLLKAMMRRGLSFGLGLAAVASLPVSLVYAAVELALAFQLSPQLNQPSVSPALPDGTVVTATPSGRVTYVHPKGRRTTVMLPPLRQRLLQQAPQMIASNATGWYFFYFGLGALFVGLASAERLRRAEHAAAAFERLAQESQLRALRYQVNPHFLFNTLNSLSALVMTGRAEEAETMILNMSAFFRSTLALDPTHDITLGEELVLQRLYLDIEQGRFPERLRVVIEVPDALLTERLPALILQPLVENAIKHGVAPSRQTVVVRIAAHAEADTLVLVVENDCPGDGAARAPTECTGIGLVNVADRLTARFGSVASCSSEMQVGQYRVTLRLPRNAA